MSDRRCFVGVDVGTQGVRVALVSDRGRALGGGARSLTGDHRRDGRHEQDPEEWWTCLVGAVRDALADAAQEGPVEPAALALDATSGTVLLEASDGTPRGRALMYDDRRATDEAVRAEEVGRPLWTELGYRMQPVWALPKALWLLTNAEPARGDRVVHQADHLVRRLTGRPVATDTSTALKTGADLRTVSWPEDLLGELGLPVERLPELVLPGTVLGTVGADAAGLTGLPPGLPVRAGMTDGCAAQIASGALHPGSWSSALGTTLVVKGSTLDLVRDPHGAVYSHRHPDGGWLPGGASSTGAGVLREVLATDADLAALTEVAGTRALPSAVRYPLSGRGERFPFVAADAEGFTVRPDGAGETDDAERLAEVCRGIAYVERLAYDVLGVLGADVSGPVSLTGGATRNPWWNQLRTDVLGRRTQRPESAEAATGMAVLAAAEPGELAATADRMVVVVEHLEPDVERGQTLREGYVALVDELADRGWLDADLADAVLRTGVSS